MRASIPRFFLLGIFACLTIGCGDNSTAPTAPIVNDPVAGTSASARSPVTTAPSTTLAPTPAPSSPVLPTGQVPDVVVGRWTGGAGSRTGEYLIIDSTGRYARGENGSSPYEVGVIVAQGDEFVTLDEQGQRRSGQWQYTNASDLEVLGVYFGTDYYSYVRA